MSDPVTTLYCDSCGKVTEAGPQYCPSCGVEDPWVEEYAYDFDNVEFPIIIEWEHYNDRWEMWKKFTFHVFGEYELTSDDVVNEPPVASEMKYAVFPSYWKVTENEIKGPFLDKQEAREA